MLILFQICLHEVERKKARLQIVLELEVSNEAQVYIEEFERTIQKIECELLGSTDASYIIQELLRYVGMFYTADRAYIIEVDWDMGLGSNMYEWCTEGVSPRKSDRQNIDLEQLPQWRSAFANKFPIILDNIESIRTSPPHHATHGANSSACLAGA